MAMYQQICTGTTYQHHQRNAAKVGSNLFNLHRMEKGYFPTSLIKFQVENKTDISYLTSKNIRIGDREYALRRFLEKPLQNNRYRYTNYTEKPRRYVKPHQSTRCRKETAEKTNIEQYTNYQKTLADYARRLEKINEELKQLTNALHDIKQDRKVLKEEAKDKHITEHFWEYFHLLRNATKEINPKQIETITKQLTMKLDLDTKETKWLQNTTSANSTLAHCILQPSCLPEKLQNKNNKNKKSIPEPDKGPQLADCPSPSAKIYFNQ